MTNRLPLLLITLLTASAYGEVRLPKVLSSSMVLQRDSQVSIWGWAEAGEAVSVSGDWTTTPAETVADPDGRWQVTLATGQAGGPHQITVSGQNTVMLNDILFGEVWLASGQSNMEMPLIEVSGAYTGIQNAAQEVAESDYPQIRLFQAGNFSSREPLDDVESGITMYGIPPADCTWQVCAPETVKHFSSTAYFFARELHQKLNVPIGIIDASWGGTPAEAWTPREGLVELGYTDQVRQADELPQQPDQKISSRLYNGMIHPLRNYRIRGAIWYQGEGNTGRADQYHELFSTMITRWRETFGYDFSFYFVQIAPFSYRDVNAAFLREAQQQTLSLPQTGMVVTLDIGNLTDIHPKNKQEVGRRLALWALARDYGRDVTCSGPVFQKAEFRDGTAWVRFDSPASELTTSDGQPPSDFEVAGQDGVFHPASAKLEADQVRIWSDAVRNPTAVRYAFSSEASPNLANTDGLPAPPFRTDNQPFTH